MRVALLSVWLAAAAGAQLPADVAARVDAVRTGATYSADVPRDWVPFTIDAGGVECPHHLRVPRDYDATRRHPLLVELHGAVSRPDFGSETSLRNLRHRIGAAADEAGMLLLMPAGRRGVEWWSEAGRGNLLDAIAWIKARYNVDESRVFAGGFSDGGSGSFHLALHAPTPFAGFVPMCGHVRVAQAGGASVFLRTLSNRPLYVVNTGKDVLYPTTHVRPFIDAMRTLGVRVTYRPFESMPHAPLFLPDERGRIVDWLLRTRRPAHPKAVWIESDRPMHVDWLELEAIGDDTAALDAFPDVNPVVPPVRRPFGIEPGPPTGGLGIEVARVREETLAAALGVEAGDCLVKLDDAVIEDRRSLSRAMLRVRGGEQVRAVVLRAGGPVELEATCPASKPLPAFRRTAPRAVLHAVRDGNRVDVRAANVTRFAIAISPDAFELGQPIVVVVNGEERHAARVLPDAATVDRYAKRDRDRTRVYVARIAVTL